MDNRTPSTDAAHDRSPDPIAYLRGLKGLIEQERLDYILSRTGRQEKRQRRLLAHQVAWLVIAMSLFSSDSVPMVWRRLHPSSDTPEPNESAFTKARQRLGV